VTESLPLDGKSLTLEHFLAIVRGRCAVALEPSAREAIRAGRGSVERAVGAGRPVYGVTTGFGRFADVRIPPADAEALQVNLLRSHSVGQGPPLPETVVRGMMLLRLNSLAQGLSGVRLEVAESLLAALNRGLYPYVPTQGSVGASGDLAPLAHLALALLGEGECLDPDGHRRPAAEVLDANGLAPLRLGAKEGVALINGTSLMATYLALGVADGRALLAAAEGALALSWDALQGSLDPLDDRVQLARNLPEQRAVARRLRARLEGSALARAGGEGPQDPYTLRCAPQVLAATELALGFAERVAVGELNAVSDNPLVLPGDVFLSGGNFHGQPLAFALDTLALGLQYLAAFSERRTARLLDPAGNRGLPAFLAPVPGTTSGFMIAQYLQAALVGENAVLTHPASATSLPTSANQEDFNSQGAAAGAKLQRVLENVQRVIAVEWIVAGQALEARHPTLGSPANEDALRVLRARVAPLGADRSLAPDVDRVVDAIRDGTLGRAPGGA
jgi:histidine ammonia-lyase